MRITDLKVAVLGRNPVVRLETDEGIVGYGCAEGSKNYLKPHILFYRDKLIGLDPTNVEACLLRIRRLGAFKPWGAAVSAIEVALWDLAGQAAGVPVYKLLGGKVRDKVRIYNGGVRFPEGDDYSPEGYARIVQRMKDAPQNFSIIKQGFSFHGNRFEDKARALYANAQSGAVHANRGPMTEKGLNWAIECVEAMKGVLGAEVGLALDCGPGWTVPDAIRFAKAVEPFNLMWLEDTITGDYTPYVTADVYRELTRATSTPIHTGEQIYLRQHFRELFEQKAVNIVGPDPLDVGGIAETKWIAEYADLHGILMAPHGIFDGLIGLAAQVHMAAAMPYNYIAFECPVGDPAWWYDIVEGLPDPVVVDSHITVWDAPGLGITLNPDKAEPYLREEDKGFFD